jgi:hypothetical protein
MEVKRFRQQQQQRQQRFEKEGILIGRLPVIRSILQGEFENISISVSKK